MGRFSIAAIVRSIVPMARSFIEASDTETFEQEGIIGDVRLLQALSSAADTAEESCAHHIC